MVPAASMCIGISSLVAHNLVPGLGERGRLRVNHLAVVASASSALYLGLERPDLLANLLLLTFSGLSQLAPALVAALGDRRLLQRVPALAGMVVGVALVAWLTLGKVDLHGVNAGIVALAVNVAVAVVGEAIARMLGHRPIDERPARLVDDSALRLGVSAR
jgi:SSS family solute:Na+ symporter